MTDWRNYNESENEIRFVRLINEKICKEEIYKYLDAMLYKKIGQVEQGDVLNMQLIVDNITLKAWKIIKLYFKGLFI